MGRGPGIIASFRPARVASWLVAASVVGLPAAIGGVHLVSVAVAAVILSAAVGLAARDARMRGARLRVDLFAALLLGLLALTLAQTVPLPSFLLGLFARPNLGVYRQAADFLGGEAADRSFFPVALNVPEALESALFIWACLAAYLAASGLARRSEDAADWLLKAIVTGGGLVLVLGIVQTALGLDGVLDIYPLPDTGAKTFFASTFVNPNHLAGYLTFTGLVALGLSQNAEQPRETVVLGLLFLASVVAAVLTLSRGGLVAALSASVVYAGISIRNHRPGLRRSAARLWLAGVLLVVTAVALFGYDLVVEALSHMPRFQDGGHDLKLDAIARMRDVVQAFPLAGVGPGATGDVFALYNDVSPGVIFTHAESFPLQLAIDWGIPVATIVLVIAGVALLPAMARGTAQAVLLGVGVGTYALVVHNLVDFSLSVAGVAVPASAALGVLMGLDRRDARRKGRAGRRLGLPSPVAYGGALAGIVLAPLVALWVAHHDGSAVDAMMRERYAAADGKGDDAEAPVPGAEDVAAAILRAPADSHPYFMEGMTQLRLGQVDEAQRWFRQALVRAPLAFGPLRMLARTTAQQGDEPGAVNLYARLFEAYWERREQIIPDLLALRDPAAALDQVAGEDEDRLVRLSIWLATRDRRELGIEVLRHRLRSNPALYEARRELALLLIEAGALPAADAEATQLIARHGDEPGGFLIQGILAERAGDGVIAKHMYQEAQALAPRRTDALLGLARSLVTLRDWDRLQEVVGALRPLVTSKPADLAQLHVILSRAAEAQGDTQMALHEMTMAARLVPRNVAYLVRLGDLYSATMEVSRARSTWAQAQRLDPGNAALRQRLEAAAAASDEL